MARKSSGGRYTVTGPGEEGKSYAESGPAMSYAITLAQRRHPTRAPADGTWYVRDLDGTCIVRVENVEGNTFVYALAARPKGIS